MNAPQSLLSLLGVSWESGVPIVALAWNTEDGLVGFAQGDGHLAVAPAAWLGGPRVEPKADGGVTVVPAEAPPDRPLRALCHQGACLCIAAAADGGFLTGGDDGRVVHLPRKGEPTVVAHEPGAWVDALSCHRSGLRAHAFGRRLQRADSSADRNDEIELPSPPTALAFSADGRHLAAAGNGGVTLWSDSALPRRLTWPGYHRALAFSPDGHWLVTGMQENALHGWRLGRAADAGNVEGSDIELGGYPGQPLSLSFSHDGRWLATSGFTRPVCWRFDAPGGAHATKADKPARGAARAAGMGAPVECGIESKTPVTRVSCHPKQALIAAGYHNGAVLLCQPGSDEGLFVKGSGGGAVNALAWSGDGSRLAFGTQDGVFGWVGLPDALFRRREAPLTAVPAGS
jgi:WD40 repeat protein